MRKTAGNPFFAERFLRLLQRSTLLTFDESTGAWTWDLAAAERLAITDNVVDLMVGALGRLPDQTGRLLALAACMRNRVELSLLAQVTGSPVGETARALWTVLRDGLLVPERGASGGASGADEDSEMEQADYRFVHDRVRQAAYSLLSDADRQQAHLAIGRCLLDRSQSVMADEELFELVDQLARGASLMTAEDERRRLAELSLHAAERARTSGSSGAALEYARRGIAALPERRDRRSGACGWRCIGWRRNARFSAATLWPAWRCSPPGSSTPRPSSRRRSCTRCGSRASRCAGPGRRRLPGVARVSLCSAVRCLTR